MTFCAAYGFDSDLPVQSGKAPDAAKVCNIIYALLQQQQRDTGRIRDLEDSLSRAESNLHMVDQANRRHESRLLAKDKEIGSLENKVCRNAETRGQISRTILGGLNKKRLSESPNINIFAFIQLFCRRVLPPLINKMQSNAEGHKHTSVITNARA